MLFDLPVQTLLSVCHALNSPNRVFVFCNHLVTITPETMAY